MNNHSAFGHISISAPALHRIKSFLYLAGMGIAFLLAVFTCNGIIGLLAHGVALSGVVTVFDRAVSRRDGELCGMELDRGDATCAAARIETN
jgi:hypothetical protein